MKPITALVWLLFFVTILGMSARAESPSTRPTHAPTVLVLPFVRLSPCADDAWIAPAVRRSMESDLGRSRTTHVHTGPVADAAATDASEAVRSARAAGAGYVVFGSYQVVDSDVRFIGSLIDVETGRPAGSLKSTGPISELFALQDAMGAMLRRHLSVALGNAPAPIGVPEIEMKDPLRVGNTLATFRGIEPSAAVDRHAIAGAYRRQFEPASAFGAGYGYATYFPRRLYAPRGSAYLPRGY